MPVLFILGTLVALLAFIAWDRRRGTGGAVKPLPRSALAKGWSSSQAGKWQVPGALSLVTASMSILEWFEPSAPPFAGRWSFIYSFMHSTFGAYGRAYWWAACSILLLLVAVRRWYTVRKGESHL